MTSTFRAHPALGAVDVGTAEPSRANRAHGLQVAELFSHFSSIVESAEDAIVSLNADGIVITWNVGAERLFGFSANEMLGRPYSDIVDDANLKDFSKVFAIAMRGDRVLHYETKRPRRDGTQRDVSLNMSPILAADGSVIGETTILHDITERNQREATLAASVSMLERAQRVGHIGAWTVGFGPGAPVACTSETFRMFGLPEATELTPSSFFDRVHPDDLGAGPSQAILDAIAGTSHFEMEHRIVLPDGGVRWVFEASQVMVDEHGAPYEMTGVIQDVTERHDAEERALLDDRKLRLLADHASDLIFSYRTSPDFGFNYVSPSSVTITGYTPDELYADPDLVNHHIDLTSHIDWFGLLLAGEDRCAADVEITRKPTCSRVWASQQLNAVRDASGALVGVEGITPRHQRPEKRPNCGSPSRRSTMPSPDSPIRPF